MKLEQAVERYAVLLKKASEKISGELILQNTMP
jgi:hypothetical protein